MAIQIWNGSTWVTSNDPEIYNGSTWAKINKGEIYNGSGWSTFYNRIINTNPTLTFESATVSSISVRVQTTNSENKRVYIYRSDNLSTIQTYPNSPTTSSINQIFTFTGLSANTSYTFSAYINFYDSNGNYVESSQTMTLTASTSAYIKTVPTKPQNTGTISSTKLSFSSSSSANYSTNGVTAYIQFRLYSGFSLISTKNSSYLDNNDSINSKTVEFTELNPGSSYYCIATTIYGSPAGNSGNSTNSDPISTYPLHKAAIPGRVDDYTSDINLAIVTTINPYNNGNARIQWEWSYRTRGTSTWSSAVSFLGSELVTGNSDSFYGQNFSIIESREYRFQARVYYQDLNIYGDWSGWSSAIRGKTWNTYYTNWISANSTSSSSNASGYSSSMGSDGNTSTAWFSNPYHTESGTAIETKSIVALSRAAAYGINTYYTSPNHAIESGRPSVSTTIYSLRYAINSISRDTTQSQYVVCTLDSSSRCILAGLDLVSISGSSNSQYNQSYYVAASSGATVWLAPRGTTPANCSSSSGGTLIVNTSNGIDVSVLGGTSNYFTKDSNYFTRLDSDYGNDIPFSYALGLASYTITTSNKVSSRWTEHFAANFITSLPSGYRNAKLYQFFIRVGPTGTPKISSLYVDGIDYTQFGSINNLSPNETYTVTPNSLNDSPYYIEFDIDSAYYSGDGLYYATVSEVQIKVSYEILEF